MTSVVADIDVDFADRDLILEELLHIPACIITKNDLKKHNTGVYFQDIPIDPVTGLASIDHRSAKAYGYFKFDFLNLSVYKQVKSETHLQQLIDTEPLWDILNEKDIVDSLFHLHDHFNIVSLLKPRSIEQLAMVLAIKIPCKRYLIGKDWKAIEAEIWLPDANGAFQFKKSHSLAYAMLVVVQMNLLLESLNENI
jgi:hypothetical protein